MLRPLTIPAWSSSNSGIATVSTGLIQRRSERTASPGRGDSLGRSAVTSVALSFIALTAPVGALVTLLPVNGDADGVTTEGLRYPLRGETLRFGRARGLSNEVASLPATVSLDKGTLLVFETPRGGTT